MPPGRGDGRQAGGRASGREKAKGEEGREGSAARNVCGVGAYERRGGVLPGGRGKETERIDTYIDGLRRTHIHRNLLGEIRPSRGRPCQPQPPDPLQTFLDLPYLPLATYLCAQTPARGGKDEKKENQ